MESTRQFSTNATHAAAAFSKRSVANVAGELDDLHVRTSLHQEDTGRARDLSRSFGSSCTLPPQAGQNQIASATSSSLATGLRHLSEYIPIWSHSIGTCGSAAHRSSAPQ